VGCNANKKEKKKDTHQPRQPVGSDHEGFSNKVQPAGDSGEIIAFPSGFW